MVTGVTCLHAIDSVYEIWVYVVIHVYVFMHKTHICIILHNKIYICNMYIYICNYTYVLYIRNANGIRDKLDILRGKRNLS